MAPSYPLGQQFVEDFNTQAVEIFDNDWQAFMYLPVVGGAGVGQDGLTDPPGMLLMRDPVDPAVNAIPWVPDVGNQPIAVLGSEVIHEDPAVLVNIRAIVKGDIAQNLLNYFDPATNLYPLLSTLVGSGATPSAEEAYDLLRHHSMNPRFVQLELTKFDNSTPSI